MNLCFDCARIYALAVGYDAAKTEVEKLFCDQLDEHDKAHRFMLRPVAGHAGFWGNERADCLARAAFAYANGEDEGTS